jgi:lysophospholipase L1-like esterase
MDTSIFGRLKRLFSTDVIVRNIGGNQLKVMDTERVQATGQIKTNALVDRYQRIHKGTCNALQSNG